MGLGNPGPEYEDTRHNVGFRAADELASRARATAWERCGSSLVATARIAGELVRFAKPQTFMNRSGTAVRALLERLELDPSAVLVLHDDLDLPFGQLRIRPGGGHGGHNGLRSLLDVLGTGDFARVKIGIGRPERKEDVVEYVLSPFDPLQRSRLKEVLERAAEAAETLLAEGVERAMNRYNRAQADPQP